MSVEISVIIPVYNDYFGLETTLGCLQKQSMDRDKFEIIVANDGGDERIKNICKKYSANVINIIPNQGAYKARNTAIGISKSENLAFTDSDIVIEPDWLVNGLEALENAQYVVGPVKVIEKPNMKVFERYEYYTAFDMQKYFEAFGFGGAGNLFVKKAVFETVGMFDERLRSGGDGEFGRRVFISKRVKQSFEKNILVYHPLRTYEDMINKVKRVSKGIAIINRLRPESLHPRMKPSILKSIYLILIPPNIFKAKYNSDDKYLNIFLFHWYYKALNGFYSIIWIIRYKSIFKGQAKLS